ncbi:ATP-binding protein [Sulfolobus tengchongensis]|uniref:ATP-binding protein n=1 Tax=Sulfolobus tengchongensis TaxID=207809 RepID=A0AAX4L5S2_9CREN
MDDNELLEIMKDWNFWGNFTKQWIEREEYVGKIKNLLKGVNIVAISGIRRSGKSIIGLQVIKKVIEEDNVDPRDTLVIKLDDERLTEVNYNTLLRILSLYEINIKKGNNFYILIDEVQEVEGWERIVRGLAEKGNKVIVTGSSAKLLSSEYTTLLSGRHVEVRVFTLDLMENLSFKGIKLRDRIDEIKHSLDIDKSIEELMNLGGFPDVVLHKDIADELLTSYFESIILKDVISRYKIRDESKLRVLAKFYITSSGSRVTYSNVSKFLKIPVKTVERYSEYLEKVFLIFFLKNFSFSVKGVEVSPRKVYVTDNGFMKIFSVRISRGRLFETLLAQHLFKYSFNTRADLYYWHEKEEIDFILQRGDIIQPIQVAYEIESEETLYREIDPIKKFKDKVTDIQNPILIVYRGEEKTIDQVKILSVKKFLLHIEDYLI